MSRNPGGFFNRAGQHGADPAILEHEQTTDGAAGGGGDIVTKRGRMAAGVEDHTGCAESRLRNQRKSKLPGESDFDARVGKSLHDQEEIGGATAAQRGDGVEMDLVHGQALSNGVKDSAGAGEVINS